ncbi:MAG: fatty acid CoA ligase family protein, partial [Candidatus Hodarchaeota archaeon]
VDHAARTPFRTAVIVPVGRDEQGRSITIQLSFQQLNELVDQYAHGLTNYGFRRGDRVLTLIPPGIDLIAVALALLKMGSIPTVIDPGMGLKAFAQCVSEAEPTGFIAISRAHILRRLFRKSFRTIKHSVIVGKRGIWGGKTLEEIRSSTREPFPVANTSAEDEAVVGFTSGGTGIPKGVLFLHGMLQATVESISKDLKITEGEIHLAAFYAFALFMPSIGATIIIPDMDPSKTAEVNPAYLVEAIQTYGVTNSMGSPIIWKKVAEFCLENNISLPSVKHVFMFGAAVPPGVVRDFTSVLDGGKAFTPYGATEALPLTNIDDEEILKETESLTAQGAGVCVGRPIAGATVRIIKITDEPILSWDDSLVLPQGQIGEITAKGPTVTQIYLNRPKKTAKAKINSTDGIWHRMGDLGYIDEKGRLWFCGRKGHRVETSHGLLTPVQCESIFNQHPDVKRTALIGFGEYGNQHPVILVEPEPDKQLRSQTAKDKLIDELLILGEKYEHTRQIKRIFIYDKPFPVDIRHNTKIQRQKLIGWARSKVK